MKIPTALLTCLILVSGEEILIRLARDLEKRYYITCTTILYTGNLHRKAFLIGKGMMMMKREWGGFVTVQSVENYLQVYGSLERRECTRFFYLLLTEGDSAIDDVTRLTRTVTMSGTVWLIYLPFGVSITDYFRSANVAYDMDTIVAEPLPNGRMRLSDVYRVSLQRPVRVEHYGVWSMEEGFFPVKVPIAYYMRRQDLEGITMKVAIKHSPPNHAVVPDKHGNGIHLKGMLGKVWRQLETRLNFSSVYAAANSTGAPLENDSWNGMIGMMLRDGMDAGIGEVTMSKERCAVLYCLRPLVSTRNQLYFKKTGEQIQWDAILKPFHANTWTTILLWLVTSTACLNVCYRIGRWYQLDRSNFDFNITNSLEVIYSALCQQGSYATPDSISCRVIFFISYIAAEILFTVYSASLTSYLAAQKPYRPFENLHQLLMDGSYTLQPIRDSAAHIFYSTATDAFSREIYRKLIAVIPPDQLPMTLSEGLDRACADEKIVYFGTEFATKASVAEINFSGKCKIISLENPLNMVYVTFLLSRASPFKDLFNHNLDALMYNGMIGRLIKITWEQMKIAEEEKFVGVGMTQIFQIYLLLFVGICLSLLFFLAEKVTHRAALRRNAATTRTVT